MESNLEGTSGNIEIVRRIMDAVRERDLTVLVDTYASDIEIHDAESLPYGGIYRGHQGMIENGMGFVRTWDQLQTSADRDPEAVIFGSGDQVVALWRLKASGKDGQRLDRPAISLFQLRDRKVVRLQMFHYDTAAIGRFLQCQTA
jgi:uncharacterized protein